MTTTQVRPPIQSFLSPESILVVKREYLFIGDESWSGMRTDNMQRYLNIVAAKKEFLPRDVAEKDPRYKQIIPYLLFMHE